MRYMYKNDLGWQTQKYREYVDSIWEEIDEDIRTICSPDANGLSSPDSWHDAIVLDVKVDSRFLMEIEDRDPDSIVCIGLKLRSGEHIKLDYIGVEEADIPLSLAYNSIREIYVHELVLENQMFRHEFEFVGFGWKPWVIKSKEIKLQRNL